MWVKTGLNIVIWSKVWPPHYKSDQYEYFKGFTRKIIIIDTVTEQCPTLFSSIQNYNNDSHAK